MKSYYLVVVGRSKVNEHYSCSRRLVSGDMTLEHSEAQVTNNHMPFFVGNNMNRTYNVNIDPEWINRSCVPWSITHRALYVTLSATAN